MTRAAAAPVFRDLASLQAHLATGRARRMVLANGCFDPLHVGHVRYLEDAASRGDYLVVALNNDASASRLKGAGRPVVDEESRARVLAGLAAVDAVLIFDDDNVERILASIRPAVHAKGTDYTPESVPEAAVARALGIETVIAGDPKAHASRDIVARIRSSAGDAGSS